MTELSDELLDRICDNVVSRLFVNGFGEPASRLVLEQKATSHKGHTSTRDLGGWCRGAAADQVRDAIREELMRPTEEAST